MKYTSNRFVIAAFILLYISVVVSQPAGAQSALPFDDISKSYGKQAIVELYNKKIITAASDRSFSPDKPISRAEFVSVLDRLLRLEPAASPVSPFTDLAKQAWYYGWIQAAVQLGLVDGISANAFAPAKPITRQEAAVIMARALKQPEDESGVKPGFDDNSQIAEWASSSVMTVHELGLLKGDKDGRFRPADPITRQETAVMIHRVLQNKQWAATLAAKPKEMIKLGWQYAQTTLQYEKNVLSSHVNTLSPRWYNLGAAGNVSGKTDPALVTWAKKNNKKVWPLVGNRSDQAATHQMLSNSAARNTAIANLTAIVRKYDLDGLNIDFENVSPQDRKSLTVFITGLSEKLKDMNATLSVDVSPDRGTDWTEAFDYASLGDRADYIVLMGYDEHWGGSPEAGSIASLGYDTASLNKLLKAVPGHKVILALPFYNRDWNMKEDDSAKSSELISLSQQNALIEKYRVRPVWDAHAGQYTAAYTKNGESHKIWLEDGRSLTEKYKLAADAGIAGLAYWYMGGESPDIWASMRNADRFLGYSFVK